MEYISRTPGSHSVCAIRTRLGVNRKILSIRKEPMLSGVLILTLASHATKNVPSGILMAYTESLMAHTERLEGM